MKATALVVALTPRERDLLVSVLRLAEEFEADTQATRPLIELLERAMTTKEAAARPCRNGGVSERPSADQLLERPHALLTRSHLRELGLGRAAVDAVFRELEVVVFPGSTRPHVRVADYLALVERSTYGDDRVRLR